VIIEVRDYPPIPFQPIRMVMRMVAWTGQRQKFALVIRLHLTA